MTNTKEIRAIVFKDGDAWVAQCLEYDIGAQAATVEELDELLDLTIRAELQASIEVNGEPFKGIPPAPKFFFDMWGNQAGTYEPRNPSNILADHNQVKVHLALCA